jgi:hypothetical protein
VGLNIHRDKTKILKINFLKREELFILLHRIFNDKVKSFTYLGSVIDQQGEADVDVKTRTNKARVAFIQLNNTWRSTDLPLTTNIHLFNSNVKSKLLQSAKTWTTTNKTIEMKAFTTSCLRKVFQFRWSDTISNNIKLWERTHKLLAEINIMKRKFRWIGHTLRKPQTNTTRQVLK